MTEITIIAPLNLSMQISQIEMGHDHGTSPNLLLNSDSACITSRSLLIFRFLGSAQRLGAAGAA